MALYLDGQKIVNSLVIDGELANLTTKSITTNGTYNAEDDNAYGYSSVSVNTPEAVKTLVYELGAGGRWETFTNPNAELLLVEVYDSNGDLFVTHPLSAATISNLGIYTSFTTFYPTFDGGKKLNLSRTNDSATIYISVNEGTSYSVKVYSLETTGTVDLATKSITANGTYKASSDDLDGYSSVNVNVISNSVMSYDYQSNLFTPFDLTNVHGKLQVDYGIIDLGTLNWSYNSSLSTPVFSSPALTNMVTASDKCLLEGYTSLHEFWAYANNDKCVAIGGSNINISNFDYTDPAAFKNYMSGKKLLYLLKSSYEANI